MTDTFGDGYADAYDHLYADKDYEAEVDLIERLVRDHGGDGRSVLDLGCGTGRHAVLLAARGHQVTGIDLSPAMLEVARSRANALGIPALILEVGDVRHLDLDRRFDVVLLMFAVLGYQTTDADVLAALQTASRHLSEEGVLIFDVWNGPAVETIGPTMRSKEVVAGDSVIERRAVGTLVPGVHECIVDYTLAWRNGTAVVRAEREQHRMRYFFREELAEFARRAGLVIVADGAFPEFDRPASDADWNALYVARPA